MKFKRTCKYASFFGVFILGAAIVGMLSPDFMTVYRLRLMSVDVVKLKKQGRLNVGFRCADESLSSAIPLVERYVERLGLSVNTIYVLDPVGDRGLEMICRMKCISSIDRLSIYSRAISNNGVHSIGAAKDATTLVLQCPSVDSDGIQYLVDMSSLEFLDLSQSGVDDKCFMFLAKLRSLEHLFLAETRTSEDAIYEFKKKHPDVGVVR